MNKSQFFKYLADGGKVEMISFHGDKVPTALQGVRYAIKVQSNAIKFNNDSWLYKHDIKASDVTSVAIGETRPGVNLGWCIYKLVSN